jgi:hypothetical protein
MALRARVVGLALASMMVAPGAVSYGQSQSTSSASSASSTHRLFLRFVEDGAIVPSYWLEGQGRWQTNTGAFGSDEGDASQATVLSATGIFAMNVAEDFEFGGRIGLAHRDPDDGSGETGLTDTDIWGKFSISTDPVVFSAGLLITAPTGSDDKFLGTGETNIEFFGGLRKDLKKITLSGTIGARLNQDVDFGDVELEGNNSLLGGAAMIISAGQNLALILEYAFETPRYENTGNDSRIMGGFEWNMTDQLMVRGAVGTGLSNGAPDFDLIGSVAWLF